MNFFYTIITIIRGITNAIFGGVATLIFDIEDFPQTKLGDKEGFPCIPMSTNTIGVLQFCLQAKCLGGLAPPMVMSHDYHHFCQNKIINFKYLLST